MNSFVLFLSLVGCFEYALNKQEVDPSTIPPKADDEQPMDTAEETDGEDPVEDTATEDTNLEPDGECGFHIQNGPLDEAFVMSYPHYTLQTEEVYTLQPGEPLQLWFGVTADPCGDIEVNVLQFAITDHENGATWLMPVYEEAASVRDPSDEFTFGATPPNGIVPDRELHWTWSDGLWPLSYDFTGEMNTVSIPAGETTWFIYEFPHTELAPIGTIADLRLSNMMWRDLGTEQRVQAWCDGNEDMWTTVEFVE
jgi:hypothetical protein